MQQLANLESILRRIDGRGYKAYREIRGGYSMKGGSLFMDHVQGDPFATPSRVRVRLDQNCVRTPPDLFSNRIRRLALQDFLARRFRRAIGPPGPKTGNGKSGLLFIDAGGQEVLDRTAVVVGKRWVEVRLDVGLPAAGRRILGREASRLLCDTIPECAIESSTWSPAFQSAARQFVECIENQEAIRSELNDRALVAFVADGSNLARDRGVSDRPLSDDCVVRFKSPMSLYHTFELPNPMPAPSGPVGEISGMGIPRGVTLIAGGGYHGKSTLLRALERGIYPHIPGDGREYVVTEPDAVKVRAEDRRAIAGVDISLFITDLPDGRSTAEFSTDEASGSTSQAAAIMEALESGGKTILIDEDTSATNLLVRDARMQALVSREGEPITPLIDRVRMLYANFGISSVMVMGGSGDYFEVADTVIVMDRYVPEDATKAAKRIAEALPTSRQIECSTLFTQPRRRIPRPDSIRSERRQGRIKIDAASVDTIRFGHETIDLRAVEQILDRSQTRAIGYALHFAATRLMQSNESLSAILDRLEDVIVRDGIEVLSLFREGKARTSEVHPGNLARPRRHEVAAALNRLRTLAVISE